MLLLSKNSIIDDLDACLLTLIKKIFVKVLISRFEATNYLQMIFRQNLQCLLKVS